MSLLNSLRFFDHDIAVRIFKVFDRPPYRSLIEFFCLTADGFTWLLGVPLLVFLLPQGHELFLSMLYMGIFVDIVVTGSIKAIIRRKRPPHNKDDKVFIGPDNHSFPSGHTTRAFFVSTYTVIVLGKLWIFIYVWAVLIGLARLALGRHYPSDVIMGALIGSIVGFILGVYVNLSQYFLVRFMITYL